MQISGETVEVIRQIGNLKRERDALVLAHNCQRPEVQDIADHTGDSLELSRIRQAKRDYPEARVMAHPECRPEILELVDRVAGTAGMLAYAAKQAPRTAFIVGTDIGLIHRLKKENPDKSFYPATDYLVCPTMKLTTLEDVLRSLERMEHVVRLEESVRVKARLALDAMLAVT